MLMQDHFSINKYGFILLFTYLFLITDLSKKFIGFWENACKITAVITEIIYSFIVFFKNNVFIWINYFNNKTKFNNVN